MIFKLLAVMVVIFLVYLVFFKKNREKQIKKNDAEITDNMDECPTCKTYVAKDDAILSNGKYYCSQECLSK